MDKPAVLVIDDDPAYLESISLALEGHFLVRTALNGLDALKTMNDASRLSLILLDLHMPEMTGVELLETVRRKNKNIPILIVTGKGTHEWGRRCADLGVQGYLDKLIDIEELIGKMKKLYWFCYSLRRVGLTLPPGIRLQDPSPITLPLPVQEPLLAQVGGRIQQVSGSARLAEAISSLKAAVSLTHPSGSSA